MIRVILKLFESLPVRDSYFSYCSRDFQIALYCETEYGIMMLMIHVCRLMLKNVVVLCSYDHWLASVSERISQSDFGNKWTRPYYGGHFCDGYGYAFPSPHDPGTYAAAYGAYPVYGTHRQQVSLKSAAEFLCLNGCACDLAILQDKITFSSSPSTFKNT
ncbi:hypothetical protein H5410_000992 [Solanum commersonii]|uniref:Uncharacterized protein n=1 Tax=Solanum commersonii TaxID=4109 RepID=A0A9J6AYG7_SOLCO|nr:hypothetical protein H5410_000992 [Solanum commersonii]